MFIAKAHLKSLSPYSQSRYHSTPKKDKESPADYEKRVWRQRMHTTDDGLVFIPPMAFKHCIAEVAKYLSEKIPGKNRQTYTKHFKAGVLVTEPLVLDIRAEDVQPNVLFVPSNGQAGSGSRVEKIFPMIPSWEGVVEFMILDETLTEDVFKRHLEQAGQFIGVGTFRPINNGYFGRFEVIGFEWNET